ncbi:hypothetical protein [Fibrella aquatica]|uniref:hypothetical protein n=1 Tax=Fibrella aquatica TaxID=3242487 RepID=UPI003521B55C
MNLFRQAFTRFVARNIVTTGPVTTPIAPVLLAGNTGWETHFVNTQAVATLRRLINQDMLRWLDHQDTYAPPHLLERADQILPEHFGIVILTHEQWVRLTYVLVTYQIVQEQLGAMSLLDDLDPVTILAHLANLRQVPRFPLAR